MPSALLTLLPLPQQQPRRWARSPDTFLAAGEVKHGNGTCHLLAPWGRGCPLVASMGALPTSWCPQPPVPSTVPPAAPQAVVSPALPPQ